MKEDVTQSTLPGTLGKGLGRLMLASLLCVTLPQALLAQAKDKVTHYNDRNERVVTEAGMIEASGLDGLTIKIDDETTRKVDANAVMRIVWGEVPSSFTDGDTYWKRQDYASALTQYRLAASDGDARTAVQAAARMRSIECLMKLGASDAGRFTEAMDEAGRYISDHSTGFDLARATQAKARALWLTGKPQEASDLYNGLFEKGSAKAAGYPSMLCYESGLQAAWSALDAADTGKARTYFTATQTAIEGALGDAIPTQAPQLQSWAATASIGEGFCLLKSGDSRGARSFFEGKQSSSTLDASGVFAATLGLGEALLAAGEAAEAQVHLARVSALDPSGRDRTARALLGLAKCMKALGDPKAETQASILLAKVKGAYGDTPAAVEAAKVN
ncbi:MAG: hypothetical protein P1V35_06085 [Planctomycetota bacterium]|nr:hypothetical protein [Planctomycetota bacterium]